MAPQEKAKGKAERRCLLLLSDGTTPSPNDVLIGRGRRFVHHNKRFYKIIESELQEYECSAQNKTMKSLIILRVMKHIKEEVRGRFLKKDKTTARWMVVEDNLARTTIAQAFRDRLNKSYRSSKESKQRRRALAKYSPSSLSALSSPISVVTSAEATTSTDTTASVHVRTPTGSGDISCSSKPVAGFNIVAASGPLPSPQLSRDQAIQNLRASIQDALDMTNDGMAFGDTDDDPLSGRDGPGTAIMDSLDGPSLVPSAFGCGGGDDDDDDDDFTMSSSFWDLFQDTDFEGNPFEPIPVREPISASK